jgi:hypothetical protein
MIDLASVIVQVEETDPVQVIDPGSGTVQMIDPVLVIDLGIGLESRIGRVIDRE